MLDTHAVARSLTDPEFTPAQAGAITTPAGLAAERGGHDTSDPFATGLAEVRTEIAALDTRLSTEIAEPPVARVRLFFGGGKGLVRAARQSSLIGRRRAAGRATEAAR